MTLVKYKKKRNLTVSKEPKATVKKKTGLAFVVQEHHATHLHYDLRLELEGVLKSWAIPKKPSLDPKVKRLAIMVEDHPYDYKDFHGVIPEGYGAGVVKIWDKGTYSVEGNDPKESQKLLKAGLKKGHVRFTLKGRKLKGDFHLVHLNRPGKNQWLFFKSGSSSPRSRVPKVIE